MTGWIKITRQFRRQSQLQTEKKQEQKEDNNASNTAAIATGFDRKKSIRFFMNDFAFTLSRTHWHRWRQRRIFEKETEPLDDVTNKNKEKKNNGYDIKQQNQISIKKNWMKIPLNALLYSQ